MPTLKFYHSIIVFSFIICLLSEVCGQSTGFEINYGQSVGNSGGSGLIKLNQLSNNVISLQSLYLDDFTIQTYSTFANPSGYCGYLDLQRYGGNIAFNRGGGLASFYGPTTLFNKLAFYNPTNENYNIQSRASSEIAFGAIDKDGTILSNTENISTVTWNEDFNRYEITIDNIHYNSEDYTTLITPITDDGIWAHFGTNDINNKLTVQFYTGSVSVQRKFHFVIYQYETTPIIANEDGCNYPIVILEQDENNVSEK